jgi:hypothetical protein
MAMSEICAILKARPWVDRSKPKPEPEKVVDVVLPDRKDGENDAFYLGRVKEHVVKEVAGMDGLRIRATPSKVVPNAGIKAAFVAYVEPKVERPKRIPVALSGPAAMSKRR